MRLYCTLFDRNYLIRGLALYESLARHDLDFLMVVLCIDRPTHDALSALALRNVRLILVETLEARDPELLRVRPERSLAEFCFTCKPVLMQYALDTVPQATRVTYLDSDLYFFANPEILEVLFSDASVALTPHRFPDQFAELRRCGEFNAGWVSANNSAEGLRFLDWWRLRCMEWCKLEVEPDRFGDQKYLDRVPNLFSNVLVMDHPGANAAPWNLGRLSVSKSGTSISVNGVPLVFFHFHGIRHVVAAIYESGLIRYGIRLTTTVRDGIYRPYFTSVETAALRLAGLPSAIKKSLAEGRRASRWQGITGRLKLAILLISSGTAIIGRRSSPFL